MQSLCLIHFYKSSTQLVFIAITHDGGPQLSFHQKISQCISKKPKTTLQTSTSSHSTLFWKFWINSLFCINLFLNSLLLLLFDIFIAYKVVELFSCTSCIESFEVYIFSFNFVSLLDRIFMQQSSKDISTKSHTWQNIKNIKNITKTSQKHHFNILKSSLNIN